MFIFRKEKAKENYSLAQSRNMMNYKSYKA